ncbi:unnamed protein product [Phytophthora lilii]|uniref:Unnamed protein product n=1 Tax=Phytophthora lilii TaxID=2077276 RepID=A0A9W6TV98_9STRA|nr:unnamed protein product [Phytophthora lilii]
MNIPSLLWCPAKCEAPPVLDFQPPSTNTRQTAARSSTANQRTKPLMDKPKSSARAYKVIPDKERKKSYRLSATQKQSRQDTEAFKSRVLNLTLDINSLRQQVRQLTQCRDLQVTRMLLDRERMEFEMLVVAKAILFGERRKVSESNHQDGGCNFSGSLINLLHSEGVYEFAVQLDTANQYDCSSVFATVQVLSFVEDDAGADDEEAAALRQICSDPSGCVVEAVGDLSGRLTRRTIIDMFPHTTLDHTLVDYLVELRITCPARLLLFFNARRQILKQTAQIDAFVLFNTIQQGLPTRLLMTWKILLQRDEKLRASRAGKRNAKMC